MRKLVLLVVVLLSGCAFSVDVQRDPAAPALPPAPHAEVIAAPPEPGDVVHLARLEAQGNNWQGADDCAARLVVEARQLGGDLVHVQPEAEGIGQGPRCVGEVYRRRVQ